MPKNWRAIAVALTLLVSLTGTPPLRAHEGEHEDSATEQISETVTLAELRQETHFHGIAVDAQDPTRLYLATHHGLFVVYPDGHAMRISENRHDYMGFVPHPADPSMLYASGHPAEGGNLGFIVSTDGGRTWRQRAEGIGGPVDFHQLDVSKADPRVIYGVYGKLQVSTDGGHTWKLAGLHPEGLIDLAASAVDMNRLYAATKNGLLYSEDRGESWKLAYQLRQPASMVHVTTESEIYAFILGVGLVKAKEPGLAWTRLNETWGDSYVLHFAVDPTDPQTLYAATQGNEILKSQDGGLSWMPFGES